MKKIQINDIESLAHTQWNCKYHIVFASKYRRKVFYEGKKLKIGQMLRQLCEWKGIKIINKIRNMTIFICWWRYRQNIVYQR